jgi:CheY-like chemotaxis protein
MTQGSRAVVLLIEDDPDHAELVVRALAEDGDRVRLVHLANGGAALQYLEREGGWADPDASPRPDLILLDLRLPGMSGGHPLHLADPGGARGGGRGTGRCVCGQAHGR